MIHDDSCMKLLACFQVSVDKELPGLCGILDDPARWSCNGARKFLPNIRGPKMTAELEQSVLFAGSNSETH